MQAATQVMLQFPFYGGIMGMMAGSGYSHPGKCVNPACPQELKLREMGYAGIEKKRGTLKYRCPAKHYGTVCKGEDKCPVKGSIRVSLSEDRRIFAPLPRPSYRWENLYKKRTSVERVNSRLDVSFGFERHFIRGLKKMDMQCSLALCVMLAMALGRVKEKRPDLTRSLVQSA